MSLHPTFPAIVALWFAILLGLGSMVMPSVLLERAVEATGIGAMIPAAAPPLGLTARGLVALVAAFAGALAGLAIARRVQRAHDSDRSPQDVLFGSGARPPINVNEEIGSANLLKDVGLPASPASAVALVEDLEPSGLHSMAPLPGTDDQRSALAFKPLAPIAGRPLESCAPAEDGAAPKAAACNREEPAPLPFTAPSLARRVRADAEFPESEPSPTIVEPDGELGLVELVERLGASIERRRAGPTAAPHAPAPSQFDPAPAEEAVRAMAAYFDRPVATANKREVAPRPFDRPPGSDVSSGVASSAARAETDAALRAALATLQRMSGAA